MCRRVTSWPATPDRRVVVLCSEGYTSSLAAAVLQQFGIRGATDVVGGFRAWRAAGLPTAPGGLLDGRDLGPGALRLAAHSSGAISQDGA